MQLVGKASAVSIVAAALVLAPLPLRASVTPEQTTYRFSAVIDGTDYDPFHLDGKHLVFKATFERKRPDSIRFSGYNSSLTSEYYGLRSTLSIIDESWSLVVRGERPQLYLVDYQDGEYPDFISLSTHGSIELGRVSLKIYGVTFHPFIDGVTGFTGRSVRKLPTLRSWQIQSLANDGMQAIGKVDGAKAYIDYSMRDLRLQTSLPPALAALGLALAGLGLLYRQRRSGSARSRHE